MTSRGGVLECAEVAGLAGRLNKFPPGREVVQTGFSVIESANVVRDLVVMLDGRLRPGKTYHGQLKLASSICVGCVLFVGHVATSWSLYQSAGRRSRVLVIGLL